MPCKNPLHGFKLLVIDNRRVQPVNNSPLFGGVVDREVMLVSALSGAHARLSVPDDLPAVYVVFEYLEYCGARKMLAAARLCTEPVDRRCDGRRTHAALVEVENHVDKLRFGFIDLQRGRFADFGFIVAIRCVRDIAAVFDRRVQSAAQALF